MSYKAFGALKQHVEIELLKSMSYEEINAAINELGEKIRFLEKENAALKAAEVDKTGAELAKCEMPTLEEVKDDMMSLDWTGYNIVSAESGINRCYDYIRRHFAH